MLYYFLVPLASEHIVFNVFRYLTFRSFMALISALVISLVIGPWVRGGTASAVDRQLGMAYGAEAVQALEAGKNGVMVAFVPPEIKFVPLAEAINKVRTVPAHSEFLKIASSLGIYCGK